MKLPAVALLLLAGEATAFSWTGNFGERIVSGSSAQVRDDRYGNVNQLHGKHCHDYTREREAFEATLTKNIQQPPPQQQQQQPLPEPEPEPEQEQPPASAASATEQTPAATAVAATAATTTAQKTPAIQGPSSTTANRIGDRYANSLNDDMSNKTGARPVPDTRNRRPARASSGSAMSPDAVRNRGELHGGYGGYSQPLGTFSVVSGSSAQFVNDRYGNINQLHGKHCHDYTQEREAFEAQAGAKAAAAVAAAQSQNIMPRPDDVVGKDPNVNQEAC